MGMAIFFYGAMAQWFLEGPTRSPSVTEIDSFLEDLNRFVTFEFCMTRATCRSPKHKGCAKLEGRDLPPSKSRVCVPCTSRKEGMHELQAVQMTTVLALLGLSESLALREKPLAAVGQSTGA